MKNYKNKNIKVSITGGKSVGVDLNNFKLADLVITPKKLKRSSNLRIKVNTNQAGIRG